MVKYLVRFISSKEGKKLYDFQSVDQELIHEYHEVEELPYKDGFYTETYWDEEEQKLKQSCVEIPKSEIELLEQQMELTKKAIAEALKDKKGKLVEDELSELDE